MAGHETPYLREILTTLRRHIWMVLAAVFLAVGWAAYQAFTEVPQYRARALIRMVDARGNIASGMGSAEGEQLAKTDLINSRLLVLQGSDVLGQAVDRENLRLISTTPGFPVSRLTEVRVERPDWATEELQLQFMAEELVVASSSGEMRVPYGVPVDVDGIQFTLPRRPAEEAATLLLITRDHAIGRVRGGLQVMVRSGTDGVDIIFTSPDRDLARRTANAVAEVFQSSDASAAREKASRRREFLEQQLRNTDAQLEEAQTALSEFRSRREALSSRDRFAAQQGQLMQLETQRAELDADRRMYQSLLSRLQQLRQSESRSRSVDVLISSPGIAANPVVSQLYSQLVQYETERDGLTTGEWGRSASHPDVVRLNTLIAATQDRLVQAVQSHIAAVQARLTALDELRARGSAEIRQLPDVEAEEFRLVQQVSTISSVGDQLRAELQKARVSEALETGQVEIVELAGRADPIRSRHSTRLMLGLLLGLMLGGGGAILREHLNTSIRRRQDLEEVLQVPTMVVIPQIPSGTQGRWNVQGLVQRARSSKNGGNGTGRAPASAGSQKYPLVTLSQLRSTGAEAYRTLRTNLIFSHAGPALKTVMVTSPLRSEGKTTTAVNLAVTFAQQGMQVLLVDCDLRSPRIDKIFRVPREPGLTNLLLEASVREDAICATAFEGLSVLPAGTLPSNPVELLGGERMLKLLKVLAEHYDMVIIDTPPVLAASDAAILGSRVDGVLVVVRAGQTGRDAAQHAAQQLASVGARVVGAVLNDPDAAARKYGESYAYQEYYGVVHS